MNNKNPYISFADIKQNITIRQVMDVLGIANRFKWRGESATGVCPLPTHVHQSEQPNYNQFKVNLVDGVSLFHCFSCHEGGDVLVFTKLMTGGNDKTVRFWFVEHFIDSLSAITRNDLNRRDVTHDGNKREGIVSKSAKTVIIAAGKLKPLSFRLELNSSAAYLKERGLSSKTISRYKIGLCNRGVLKGYIAIPIYKHTQVAEENPVAYLGRWPGADFDESDGRPRYLWPKGFNKSRVVYGLREALATPQDWPLIVVEGPFKVYHLFQAGFPNTVATFGSSLSDEQADVLIKTGRLIILFFDGDEAGQNGMQHAIKKLVSSTYVRILILNGNRSPDDLSLDELKTTLSPILANIFRTVQNSGGVVY
jgi:DNA primase